MLSRIVKHRRTNTEFTALSHKNIMVCTCFASLPESLIISQFIKSDWNIPQFGIHFHDSATTG